MLYIWLQYYMYGCNIIYTWLQCYIYIAAILYMATMLYVWLQHRMTVFIWEFLLMFLLQAPVLARSRSRSHSLIFSFSRSVSCALLSHAHPHTCALSRSLSYTFLSCARAHTCVCSFSLVLSCWKRTELCSCPRCPYTSGAPMERRYNCMVALTNLENWINFTRFFFLWFIFFF